MYISFDILFACFSQTHTHRRKKNHANAHHPTVYSTSFITKYHSNILGLVVVRSDEIGGWVVVLGKFFFSFFFILMLFMMWGSYNFPLYLLSFAIFGNIPDVILPTHSRRNRKKTKLFMSTTHWRSAPTLILLNMQQHIVLCQWHGILFALYESIYMILLYALPVY